MTKVKTKIKVRKGMKLWQDSFVYRAYAACRDGVKPSQLPQLFGVGFYTWESWLKRKPALQQAVTQGRADSGRAVVKEGVSEKTFLDYAFDNLPPALRATWERIVALDKDSEGNAEKELAELLADKGDNFKQHLWCHALIACDFNKTAACRKVGVSWDILQRWVRDDPAFPRIMEVLHQAKKDMAEGGLFRLIRQGDSPAIIFANKTLNADRGYNPAKKLEVSGQHQHLHATVNIDDRLDRLPLQDKIRILEGMKQSPKQVDVLTQEQ